MDASTAAVIVYLIGGGWFVTTLVSLVALLTIMRQMRSLQVYRGQRALAATFPKLVPFEVPKPFIPEMRTTREVRRVSLSLMPVPQEWQLPLREAMPDQVVIMIEPDNGPTQQQKNIQRLINHLKKLNPAASQS